MSADDFKKADLIIRYSLRGIIGLGLAACAIVFNSMRDSIYDNGVATTELTKEVGKELTDVKERLIRLETRMEDQIELSKKRDQAIENIQQTLNRK